MNVFKVSGLLTLALVFATTGAQAGVTEDVALVQSHWAKANYATEGKKRKAAFEELVAEADDLVSVHPEDASAHVWAGIVYSTYAGEVSMFSAGKQVKRARAELEQALSIDPGAMSGSAYTSLGALLFQIPGFMGGDDQLAERYLREGLALNPDGIDSNYFYGLFLVDQDRLEEAERYLRVAQEAAPRPDRPLADQGRQREIAGLLAELTP